MKRLHVFTVACLFIIAGVLFVSCSNDDKSVNSSPEWRWAEFEATPSYIPTCFAIFQNKLIAAASLYIYAWDDTGWVAFGYQTSGNFNALAVFDDKLIVGGAFNNINGTAVSRIAAWDGSSWAPLGSGIVGIQVEALALYNNKLIAGGSFDSAGGVSSRNISAWDGATWAPLGAGTNGVYELAVFNDKLIVGYGRVTTWDGSTWDTIGYHYGSQTDIVVYNNKLIFAGAFDDGEGMILNHIAAWDGSSWSTLGSGADDIVYTLVVFNNELIAGGRFTTAGGDSAKYVAAWNGSSWTPLGTGMNDHVWELFVWDNLLLAAGSFTTAGGVDAYNMASWGLR